MNAISKMMVLLLLFWSDQSGAVPADGDGDDDTKSGEGGDDKSGDDDGSGDTTTQSILDNADKSGDSKDGDDDGDGDGDGKYEAPKAVPEHMRGKDADETLTKVLEAYTGAREKIAKGLSGVDGKVPETADGYEFKADGDDDKIAKEINSDASKPVMEAFRAAALEAKMTDEQFSGFMRTGLTKMAEAGMPIGISDEEATEISADAEMSDLSEKFGAKSAGVMVNSLNTWGEQDLASGVISEDELQEYRMAVGTAGGAAVIYKMFTSRLGEAPIPPVDLEGGKMTTVDANAAFAAAQAMKPGSERDAALVTAQAAMNKAYGNEPSGSLKVDMLG